MDHNQRFAIIKHIAHSQIPFKTSLQQYSEKDLIYPSSKDGKIFCF